MKRVSYIAVISVTVFSFLSVSAQKGGSDTTMPFQPVDTPIINLPDSNRMARYIHLSQYYLENNLDSSIYWADKAVSFALVKNNWNFLNYALQTRKLVVQYNLQKQQNQNALLKDQLISQQKRTTILIVAAVILLLAGIQIANLYIQKNKAFKKTEFSKSELEEKYSELLKFRRETEQENQELEKEQKETEHQNDDLRKATSIHDKLIPMIAHDMRSPLAAIQSTLSLARENILNPEEFQKLSFALEADIYNLRGMLDNMLLWAREQIVEIKINKSKFNLSTIVQDVILMHRNSLITKNINIHNYLVPDLEVFSDKEMLTAVLRNIFSNAVKFTEPGKNIYVNQIFLNKKIYLSVKDEGKGISEEVLDKIYNKEYISTRGTANEKGTGIGIIFSKDLLTNLNEQFDITSIPGKGTSVSFSISMSNNENGTMPTKS